MDAAWSRGGALGEGEEWKSQIFVARMFRNGFHSQVPRTKK